MFFLVDLYLSQYVAQYKNQPVYVLYLKSNLLNFRHDLITGKKEGVAKELCSIGLQLKAYQVSPSLT